MDSLTVARSLRGSVGMLAMGWLMSPSTIEKAGQRGMPANSSAYAIGRLGVLGDCPVDNVVGAAFFWNPDLMTKMVEESRAMMSPYEGARVYNTICHEYGINKLDGYEGNVRMGELCEKVVDNAAPQGAPVFVGWRDQDRPAPGPAHAFLMAQIMRELRFARHTIAVQAAGMGPLEAILSGPAGEWNAEFFGWSRPYPDVSDLTEMRAAIEDLTDQLHARDLDVLTDGERAELRDLAKGARTYAGDDPLPNT